MPVKISLVAQDDNIALQYEKALENTIELLPGRYSLWEGNPFDVPKNGVVIEIRSIKVVLKDKTNMGSALFIETKRPSKTERGFFKEVYEEMWVFPEGESLSDNALSYLASVGKALTKIQSTSP